MHVCRLPKKYLPKNLITFLVRYKWPNLSIDLCQNQEFLSGQNSEGVQGREKRFANLAKLQPGRARKKYLATT